MSVFPKLIYYWIQFSKISSGFLTELDKADSEYMGKQCSKRAQTLTKKNKMVDSLTLAYIRRIIIRTVIKSRQTNATERLVEKRWTV